MTEPDGSVRPVWLSVSIRDGAIGDKEHILYVDVKNYESCSIDEFYDGLARCSVSLGELVTGAHNSQIGIYLDPIRERFGGSLEGIDCFMLLVADVIEILGIQKSMFL